MSRVKKKKNRVTTPIIFMVLGASLVIAALIFGFPRNSEPADIAPQEHTAEDTFPEIGRFSLDDARTALDSGTAVFLDVRDPSAFAESHIPGARSIPLADLEDRLGELNPSDWIITYCT